MDLAAMINNGDEALHRGSVDKGSISGNSEPATPTPPNNTEPNQMRNSGKPPVWARVYRGRQNRVRDVKRWKLSETRPELSELFPDSNAQEEEDLDGETGNTSKASSPEANLNGHAKGQLVTPFSANALPPASATEVGPGGNVSLTGLTASLASLIPNDDQTKVLAGWIFERIDKLKDESLLDHIEVEFKMGLLTDEHSGLRHRFPVLSEAVVDPTYMQLKRLRFKTEVDNARFKSLESLLDAVTKANVANEMNPIIHENVLIRDEVYKLVYEPLGEQNSRIRVSIDDKEKIVECISKQRIGDLYIAMPNAAYDLKMSLSIEHPVDAEVIAPQIKSMQSTFERNKNRLKWTSPGCVVDLTSVHGQSTDGQSVVTKEAEIETNTSLLASAIREYRSASDKTMSLDKFLEIMRYTVDSARFLVRSI